MMLAGGTGFVGSVVLEQLLRLAPTVRRVYVLVREKKGLKGEYSAANPMKQLAIRVRWCMPVLA